MTQVSFQQVGHFARQGRDWEVILENTTTRSAFYRAKGRGMGEVLIRYGRKGTHGREFRTDYADAITKLGQKLAGNYRHQEGTDLTPPVLSQSPEQRSVTLRDRLLSTTIRPITFDQVMDLMGQRNLNQTDVDGSQFLDVFRGADRVSILQSERGELVVMIRSGDTYGWGVIKGAGI